MNWSSEDFATAAALIVVTTLALMLVFTNVRTQPARYILAGCIVVAALAIWAHLDVGIFEFAATAMP